MAQAGRTASAALAAILRADDGLPAAVADAAKQEMTGLVPLAAAQIVMQNVSFELAEKGSGAKYPLVYVYCEKLANKLEEKFRRFSGKAHMVMEVRVSQDRIEGLEDALQAYVDAATEVLERRRGEWANGIYYNGGYEIHFGGIKRGGKNYLQAARITLELSVHLN